MDIPTWEMFWGWIQTPLGLGIAVVAIIGALKKLNAPKLPNWLKTVGIFVQENAMLVSVILAVILSGIIYAINAFNLSGSVGKFFVIFALAWAASQGAYAAQKAATMYFGRVTSGETSIIGPGTEKPG